MRRHATRVPGQSEAMGRFDPQARAVERGVRSMSERTAPWLILVALLCSCASPAATPTPSPTSTSRPLALAPTSTSVPTLRPSPVPTSTRTPLPTSTPSPSPSPTSTPLPSPSPTALRTWPNDFQLGAVVRDISAHSELMAASGMTWVRYIAWHGHPADSLIADAHSSGLRVLLTAVGDGERAYDPDYQEEFVASLASMAEQGADAIEVWNEPNIPRDIADIDPGRYTALLCEAYKAVKAANPATLVISGAPAPADYYGGCTSEGCDDVPWLRALVEAGAAECIDFIGAHFNSGATRPSEDTGHPVSAGHHWWYFWPIVEAYYEALGGTRSLAFTALGYLSPEGYGDPPGPFAWAKDTTTSDQAAWTAEAVQMSFESDKVGMIIIWNLDETSWEGMDVRAGYALIRQDGLCPSCEALQELLLQR